MQTTLDANAPSQLDYTGFMEKAREVGEACSALKNPLIVHHLDSDGLASAAFVKQVFLAEGVEAQTLMLKKLDETSAAVIPRDRDIVFTDLGAGQIELVERLPNANKIVIDHHPPSKDSRVLQANCHQFGFDGATDACSASTAYFCFGHKNASGVLGIVGMVGDVQDRNGVSGLNAVLVEKAAESGELLKSRDLRAFGKVSRPLITFLSYFTEPFLPGLTGNDKACAVFLKKQGVPTRRDDRALAYYDLNVFERKRLASALIEYAHSKNVEESLVAEMVGDVYLFPKEPEGSEKREANEFSTMLNACGRNNKPEAGIGACLGGADAVSEAKTLLQEHRRRVREAIFYARKHTADAGPFYLLDGRGRIEDTIIGVVCGAYFSSGIVRRDKPVIGLSLDSENAVKVSSRGARVLVEKGLDLGAVMRKAAEVVGGYGGGHNIAAGASFENTNENLHTFLLKAKEVIEVQLQMR